MAVVRNKNFSGRMEPRAELIVETYVNCNFSHPEPIVDPVTGKKMGVPIFPESRGVVPRQFIECNLSNCVVPPGSLVENCNTAIVGEEWDEEIITVGGLPVNRVIRKRRVVYGRYVHNADGSVNREEFATGS